MIDDTIRAREFSGAIADYRRKHGIYVYERNGMIYECAPNWEKTCASFEAERKNRIALNAALDAHLGGGE